MYGREYKIKDEDWELQGAEKSESFLLLKYKRSHENYEYDQTKKEIYMKDNNKMELVTRLTSGILGGTWSGTFKERIRKFDNLQIYDGNHQKRNRINTGTKGQIENIYLDKEDDKIIVTNTYKTGKWSRIRDWTIEKEEN